MPLTRRQREILEYLTEYIGDHGYAPSFEEIAHHFRFTSLATVHEHLTNLERKGYVRRWPHESRGLELVTVPTQARASELPLLGTVAAGEPIEAVVDQETVGVPEDLVPRTGPNYALRVRGDSMIDEHIQDGDLVIVNGRPTANNGEMVIALIQRTAATVKRFYREPGGWVRLEPANPAVQPLRVHENDILIQGVVVGVIRKY